QLAKPLEDCLVSYEAVTKTYPHVAQHSGVSQVALPARYRQLASEMFEHRVGDAEVALGVLEVDRIDLVRHGRRAHLASHRALLEIAERNVAPDIAVQIDQNG